ncbi:MAG: FAD-dependent oxidoreductase, partial [Steroidobacteraceae bacterium]
MMNFEYDVAVIGSGPSGQRAAVQAAKLGRRTLLAECKAAVGGVCINTGTIPSKTLRQAVLHLSGYREREIYGASYAVKQNITMADLNVRTEHVIRHEIDVTRHQLQRNQVEIESATAHFVDAHTINLVSVDGHSQRTVTAGHTVIATGTRATRDSHIPFDTQSILISDDILSLAKVPRSMAVIGAGVIGVEYATIFATLGVRITLIDKRDRLLPFIDHEITDSLAYHMQQNRVTLRLGEEVRA